MAKPLRETLRHQSAFEFYFALGSDRSLPQVAQQFSVSLEAVKGWSAAFRWQKRIAQREEILKAHREKIAVQEYAKSREEQLGIIRYARAKIAAALKGDKVRFSVGDLERLGKLENLLRGEATERQDVKVDVRESQEIVMLVLGAIEKAVPPQCPHCARDLSIKGQLAEEIRTAALGLDEAREAPPVQ